MAGRYEKAAKGYRLVATENAGCWWSSAHVRRMRLHENALAKERH